MAELTGGCELAVRMFGLTLATLLPGMFVGPFLAGGMVGPLVLDPPLLEDLELVTEPAGEALFRLEG